MMGRWAVVLIAGLTSCSLGAVSTVYPSSQSCATYCAMADMYCKNGNMLFANPNDCPAGCAAYDANGIAGAVDGNTLQCRLTYLFSAQDDPIAFCLDASPASLSCR